MPTDRYSKPITKTRYDVDTNLLDALMEQIGALGADPLAKDIRVLVKAAEAKHVECQPTKPFYVLGTPAPETD